MHCGSVSCWISEVEQVVHTLLYAALQFSLTICINFVTC